MALRITRKRDNFKALIARAPQKARALEMKHAMAWASVMRQIAPIDTGALRQSIAVVTGSTGGVGLVIGVEYYRFVNYGTIYQSGQFFIEQSLEFIRKGFTADLKKFARYVKSD